MFAPPPHIRSENKGGDNLVGYDRSRLASRQLFPSPKNFDSKDQAELCAWSSRTEQPGFGDADEDTFNILDWSAMIREHNANSQKRARSVPVPDLRLQTTLAERCSNMESDSLLTEEPYSFLSQYLWNLKLILSRSKALSATIGTSRNSFKGYNYQFPYTRQTVGGSLSAPTTQSSYSRKQAIRAHNKHGVNGSVNSEIPCKNYGKLHRHKSYNDLQDCYHRAKLDNQQRSWREIGATRTINNRNDSKVDNSLPMTKYNSYHSEYRLSPNSKDNLVTVSLETSPRSNQEQCGLEKGVRQPVPQVLSVSQEDFQAKEHTTMQEYIEKYYRPPSKMAVNNHRRTLPVITERNNRLVENIINYRHSTTRERETTHKNRYLQLTAMDIRRTTAQLLKSSLHKPYRADSACLSLADPESIGDSVTANLTLTQLMAPKATQQVVASKASAPNS
ncbi:hypothetical protein EB796_012074 [Bugula neritina]|uniref:Uncharacterized protein n=1 Tax=Bugula neritina TaxID=10212 RepID=A0A7J7JTA8_BUGNE|nr:hypothetical protein EB796_012074 [Bugula neritina]